MSKKTSLCIFLLILVLTFAYANGTTEEKIAQESNEIKVISLAPNVTEIICALGAEESLIGRTVYCNYPESVSNIQNVGDMYDPNLELIISLQPTCVIASSIVSPDVVEQLNKYGIKTYQFFHEYEGLAGTFTLIKEIGDAINKTSEADELIASLKAKENTIVEITSKIKDSNKKSSVILITWGDWGDYAATGDTFLEDLIIKAGAFNIASESTYWAISKELLLSSNPDCIFITDTSNYVTGDLLETFKTTAPYSELKASMNNKVFVLDTDSTTRQSIRSFEILEVVAKALYPDLYK